mgnify:CR=1 FL=1
MEPDEVSDLGDGRPGSTSNTSCPEYGRPDPASSDDLDLRGRPRSAPNHRALHERSDGSDQPGDNASQGTPSSGYSAESSSNRRAAAVNRPQELHRDQSRSSRGNSEYADHHGPPRRQPDPVDPVPRVARSADDTNLARGRYARRVGQRLARGRESEQHAIDVARCLGAELGAKLGESPFEA